MTPEKRMAHAESIARDFEQHGVGQEIAAVLRGLVRDLRDARRELAALRAQVVSALSAAEPSEDERSA